MDKKGKEYGKLVSVRVIRLRLQTARFEIKPLLRGFGWVVRIRLERPRFVWRLFSYVTLVI